MNFLCTELLLRNNDRNTSLLFRVAASNNLSKYGIAKSVENADKELNDDALATACKACKDKCTEDNKETCEPACDAGECKAATTTPAAATTPESSAPKIHSSHVILCISTVPMIIFKLIV